jgi:hypothetical protein
MSEPNLEFKAYSFLGIHKEIFASYWVAFRQEILLC